MFKTFKVVNFKSIVETTVPLTYMEKKAPNGYKEKETIPFLETGKERLVSLLMLFGSNASGKTNLITAFSWYFHILQDGIKGKFAPNKLNKRYNTTTLELTFVWKGAQYTHLIEYDQTHIVKEKFTRQEQVLFEIQEHKITAQTIATKGYGLAEFTNILSVECSAGEQQIHSFLTKLVGRLPGLDQNISGALQYLLIDTRVITVGNTLHPSMVFDTFKGLGISFEEAFAEITHILQLLDLTITRLELLQEEKTIPFVPPLTQTPASFYFEKESHQFKQRSDRIISFHKDVDGREIPFEFFQEESQGTIRLFSIIGTFLLTLKRGGVLIWDELDASLHPCLLRELLRMFKSKRYNTTNAQLITSLHDPYILEDENVRVSDIAVINNTLNKGTTLTRVVDFDDARNDINFRKQYMEGHFRGIPNAYL
ncbi:MAG: ATP-binding protein [Elusimicrobiaceae bacterium]|nr:ATP-binding protein [Elusimicrobiaceae bacterium]